MSPLATIRPVSIVSTGAYVPERILTNAEMEKMVDTTDEWIYSRTGIRERHIARDDEASSDMGAAAARVAMQDAGVDPEEIDLIIVGTCTPDMAFPSTACFVQKLIGAKNAACMDLSAACSGFLYAMEVGRQFISTGQASTALILGAEKLSTVTNWTDRTTCVLFGDGAGAAILKPSVDGARGIMSSVLGADGTLSDLLTIRGGGSRYPVSQQVVDENSNTIQMAGREVFKHAVTQMADAALAALSSCGVSIDDIACIIPHQANARIIQAIGQKIGAPMEKFYVNVDRFGNTSAASIIIALDEAARAGRMKKGDLVLMVVFGGGFTWATSVVEW
jgi:3-oxoacyl-[acyl-carrier-protein] synthase-3